MVHRDEKSKVFMYVFYYQTFTCYVWFLCEEGRKKQLLSIQAVLNI